MPKFTLPQPPFSNTGAEITKAPVAPSENRVLIDFVSVTFTGITDPHDVMFILGLDFSWFSDMPCGAMGYKKGLRAGNISVFYDGSDGMGVHVSMSGQGCRQYEAMENRSIIDAWDTFFINVHGHGGKFTRIDIAIDNVDGQLSIEKLQGAVKNGQIRSRFKKARKISSYELSSTESQTERGTTLYFGSVSSRLQLRVYDKAEEQQVKCPHWVRAELQLRAERADIAASHYRNGKDLGALAAEIINQYVAPINHDDSNVSRCSVQEWWANWLGTTSKLKLTIAKAVKHVSEVAEYLKKQYAPSIAMIQEYLGFSGFGSYLKEVIQEGNKRMTGKHRQILAVSQL